MPVYHQMGHDSWNLLSAEGLNQYVGAILSPVNTDEAVMPRLINRYRGQGNYEVIFDPQLYYPRTEIGRLRNWSYFPNDYETMSSASDPWWDRLINRIRVTLEGIRPDAVCSPSIVPRTYSNPYYTYMVNVAGMLQEAVNPLGIAVLQTVLIDLASLTDRNRVLSIASILTRSPLSRVYLVLVGNIEPRRELSDTEELKGAMLLIQTLEQNGLHVLVGFCSSDIILWKAAGATSCATGKFWNLRRFTPTRWDPNEGGGGQLAYWFEESLLASLRESDVLRISRAGLISSTSRNNPFSETILSQIEQAGTAWVGLGWRQYLYWFADIEARIQTGVVDVGNLLLEAESNWEILEDRNILMEETRNNGRWIRPWRRALVEFQNY